MFVIYFLQASLTVINRLRSTPKIRKMLAENLEKEEEEIDLGTFPIPAYFYFELLQQRTGVTQSPGNYRAICLNAKWAMQLKLIIQLSKFKPGTVEKNLSTIAPPAPLRDFRYLYGFHSTL